MADKKVYVSDGLIAPYHDNGDGTYSPVVHLDANRGAASIAHGNGTAVTAAAVAIPARATRRSALLRNEDAANSLRYGGSSIDATHGGLLKAGEAVPLDTVAAVYVARVTADVAFSYVETYD